MMLDVAPGLQTRRGTMDTKLLRGITRRHFFEQTAFGIGGLALASLIDDVVLASQAPPQPPSPSHYDPTATRSLSLFMAGAPRQTALFARKPSLVKHDGQDIPDEFVKGERFAFIKGRPKLLGSPFQFRRHGRSGAELSELLPNL